MKRINLESVFRLSIFPLYYLFCTSPIYASTFVPDGTYYMSILETTSTFATAPLSDHGGDASSIIDGTAGKIGVEIQNGLISVDYFQMDSTLSTPVLGTFDYFTLDPGLMFGVVDDTGGVQFDPTGRMTNAGVDPGAERMNVDDVIAGSTTYTTFTTGAIVNSAGGAAIGSTPTNLGDMDGDGLDDFSFGLVSGGNLGSDFGVYAGLGYLERWDIILLSDINGLYQTTPVLPSLNNPFTFIDVTSGNWFDPPATDGFTYSMTSGALFTRILDFPTGFSSDFGVKVGGIDLGLFSPGSIVDFIQLLGFAVTEFEIYGINPTVDGEDPQAFPLKLEFDTVTASFTMTSVSSAVPLPPAVWLFSIGFLSLVGIAKRKTRRT